MSDHDRWLARYRHHVQEVFCTNPKCTNHEGIEVEYEEEYGMGWTTPEDCPVCHHEFMFDPPTDERE